MAGISEFCESMTAHGLHCPDALIADGVIHRFYVAGDKSKDKNGWYVLYGDNGLLASSYGSWKTGETFTWCSKNEKSLSDVERMKFQERIAEAKKARDEEQKRLQSKTREKAAWIWENSKPIEEHPYLTAKGVKSHGLRQYKDSLVVPARGTDGVIHSLQFINADGGKNFLSDGAIQSHFFSIDGNGDTLLVCEGYSTGATLHEATGYPVACAMNCGNLKSVCEALQKKSPDKKLIVCADDDYQTDGNPGLTKATAAAVRAVLVVPKFKDQAHRGTDFNDLHQIESLKVVKQQIKNALKSPDAGLNSPTPTDSPLDEAKEPIIPSLLPVPVDAFPDDIQTIINSLAKAHGTTPEVAVTAVLAVSGSLIGWSRRLIVKEGWRVHASLYAAISAETGEGKSPTTDFLLKPVEELERQEFLKHKAAMAEYLTELEKWQATNKDTRGQKPEPPPRKRYKMGDCTIESVAVALDGNPKGLLWYREELNGLLLDLDKYTGKEGSTKTKLIEAYDLKAWQIDRVNKDRTTYIPKPCLGVFGTIQPKILFRAFDDLDAASGFLPRFIIIYSAKTGPTLWSEAGMSDSMGGIWSRYVQALASYELELADNKDAKTVSLKSRLVRLSEDAKSEYIAWYDRIAIQPWNNVADGLFKAIVPKIQEQALRICLILHCLESIAAGKDEISPVRRGTMQRALRLADWVWSHQKRMWSLLNKNTAAEHAPLEQRIAAAIIELEPEIESSVLLTKKITEKLNKGLEKKYHIKSESVGHTCTRKLKLQKGPDKNNRGWTVTPDIINHLKSVYGLTAKITARTARTAQNPYPQVNTEAGSSFTTARTAQENTGSLFNRPTTARTLSPYQPREKGSMGSSGGYLPETSNNPNIANQPDIFDNPPDNPEWQESLNSLIKTEALPEGEPDMEVFEV